MAKRDPWLSARIDSLVHVRQAEACIEQACHAMLAEWMPAVRQAVLGHRDSLTAAADVPPEPDRVARADGALNKAITGHVRPVIGDMFGERFAASARGANISDVRERAAFVDQACQRIFGVSDRVRGEIQSLVDEGVAKGLSMDAVAKGVEAACQLDGPAPRMTMFSAAAADDAQSYVSQIRDLKAVPAAARDAQWSEAMQRVTTLRDRARNSASTAAEAASDVSITDARRIARTEVMSVVNGGTLAGMRARAAALGRPMHKQWLATADARTREDHAEADGQAVPVDSPFTVGGETLDAPGDPAGSPEQTANCRCTILEVTADEVSNPLTAAPLTNVAPTVTPTGQVIVPDDLPAPIVIPPNFAAMSDDELAGALGSASTDAEVDSIVAELDARDAATRQAQEKAKVAAQAKIRRDARKAEQQAVKDADFNARLEAGDDPEAAFEDVYGVSIIQQRRNAAIAQLESAGFKGRSFDELSRKAWREAVEQQRWAAEDATKGVFFKGKIRAEDNRDVMRLFTGSEAYARSNASDELLQFWQQHGRVTLDDFRASLLGGEVKSRGIQAWY